jgi:acyl-CoA reductase-like NAD-dependent aldehyde dehydrogenase
MIQTISPVDGKVVVERKCHTEQEVTEILKRATTAFKKNKMPLSRRIDIANKFLDLLEENKDELGREITMMMGRPIRYTPKEVSTAVMRGRYMVSIAEEVLRDKGQKGKFIKKLPVGVVAAISAWNYP